MKVFFQRLSELRIDIRRLNGLKFAAIGSATRKAIEEKGIFVDLVPETYDGKALGEALARRIREEEERTGERQPVLIPRAKIGSPDVTRPLAEAGLAYEDIPVYETAEAEAGDIAWYDDSYDYVAFTSASTVRGFVKMTQNEIDYGKVKAVCIGDQTAAEARKYGMRTYVSKEASIESMLDCFLALAAES